MGDLLIRNVPQSLKRDLQESARRAGRSLSEEVKRRLQKPGEDGAERRTFGNAGHENLSEIFSGIPLEEREEFSRIMDEIEAERKRDLGRPFSFDE